MGKKSKSKAGGDFWDEEPELEAATATPEPQNGTPDAAESHESPESSEPAESGPQGPVEADMDEEWGSGGAGGLMGALKRSKQKKQDKKQEEKEAAEAKKTEATVQVKSKKEKEREKKEREKAKKRAAAQRKVPAPAAAKKNAESETATPEPESQDAQDGESEEPAEAAAAAAAAAPAAKGGKKKKLNPALAALQKQLAAKKEAEAAAAAAEEEERKEAEEAARKAAEEEAAKEAARAAKREKDRKKKEELRSQGKLLSKKQREQQALQARRREQLLASGSVQVNGLIKQGKMKKPEPKKPEPKKEEQPEEEPEQKPAADAASDSAKDTDAKDESEEEEEALMDDWEAGLSEEDEPAKAAETDKADKAEKAEKPADKATEVKPAKAPEAPAESEESLLARTKLDAAKRAEVDTKRQARINKAMASGKEGNLRSPICAILGHVDTGKTKLLDNMRRTNVQEGEAGGITQQIGATYFPIDAIEKKTAVMAKHVKVSYDVPGLLIIDTPGHESFSNLRSRGSSLCNIAILVVDIMHGLEQQTLESIRLLKDRKTPFVVALNKIDRLYGWQSIPNNSVRDSLAQQSPAVQREFEDRLEKTKVLFAEQGFNSEVYYKNNNLSKYVSLVPTSAVTGEGVPDLIYLLLELTQSRMSKQLMYLSHLEATILEVKVIEGLGTTIDVVLSNGVLHEGDRIVLCGLNGPIATNVRALLTPQPMREMRIKSAYVHHKEVKAALGVKISAPGLEHAVAGSRLLLVGPDDDEDELMDDVMDDMTGLLDSVDKTGEGVCVQASTLGSLEALLDFLKDMKIPVMSISIGPVFKRDVMRAMPMVEKNPEFAVMLCFDVRIDKEAEQFANEHNIKMFSADIIYHLFDDFTNYQKQLLEQRRKDNVHDAVFPCVLNILQIINKRNPMIVGVEVQEGSLRIGTPIAIVKTDPVTKDKLIYNLGRVQSMEVDHKSKDLVRKGQANAGVAVRLDSGGMTNMPTWGRHIDENDKLLSMVSRRSIDVLKDPAFRDEVPREDWLLIKKLKPLFDIK